MSGSGPQPLIFSPRPRPSPVPREQAQAAYRVCQQRLRRGPRGSRLTLLLMPRSARQRWAPIERWLVALQGACAAGVDAERRLAVLGDALEAVLAGSPPDDPDWIALADVVARTPVPAELLRGLLAGARDDIETTPLADFGALMGHCRTVANPVGRLALHCAGYAEPRRQALADALCSAWALIVQVERLACSAAGWTRYPPDEDLATHGVARDDLGARRDSPGLSTLIQTHLHRTDRLLQASRPLRRALPGRLGLQARLLHAEAVNRLSRLNRRSSVFDCPASTPLTLPTRLVLALR